jgi:NAD(P)-dependent dehydrogenase (short-subunit alcohol dehydrogenase family)
MNKTAFVTGASAGIGAATAFALLAAGYRVFAGARRLDRMAALAAAGATLIKLDLTDDATIVAAVDAIKNASGRIHILVNNAGYGSYGALEDVPLDEARRQFEVNVFGLARLCQLVLPTMRAQKSGKIVNVTSIGGKIWEPLGAWYHATKFAVEGLSDCLRVEAARFGIDVIVIEPGAIRTEWAGIARRTAADVRRLSLRKNRATPRADAWHCRNVTSRFTTGCGRAHDCARRERPAPENPLRHRRRRARFFFSARFCLTGCSIG